MKQQNVTITFNAAPTVLGIFKSNAWKYWLHNPSQGRYPYFCIPLDLRIWYLLYLSLLQKRTGGNAPPSPDDHGAFIIIWRQKLYLNEQYYIQSKVLCHISSQDFQKPQWENVSKINIIKLEHLLDIKFIHKLNIKV